MSDPPDVWGEWRRDHAAALAALQDAQRAYHRRAVNREGLAASSQQSPVESSEMAVAALKALNEARVRLDEVRSRMPSQ